jgi:pimeloyl-ACP methyl ester carboxylesterase
MFVVLVLLAASAPTQAATPPHTLADYAAAGPYVVEMQEVEVLRPGTSEDFGARLFVPLPGTGDAGLSSETSPLFAFGHGYLAPIELYESTLKHLASWGITVIAPRSGGELLPSHEAFAADLVSALDHVAAASRDEDWPGLAIDAAARSVGGHSMGGGAAILAAGLDPRIRTVATLSAADTRPSAVAAAGEVEASLLLVAGSEDRITPVDQHQRPIFEAAAGPAQLRTLEGGGHCGYLDQADLIGLVCGRASLSEQAQRAQGRAALTAWLRGQLMADATAAELVSRAGDTRVTIERRDAGQP